MTKPSKTNASESAKKKVYPWHSVSEDKTLSQSVAKQIYLLITAYHIMKLKANQRKTEFAVQQYSCKKQLPATINANTVSKQYSTKWQKWQRFFLHGSREIVLLDLNKKEGIPLAFGEDAKSISSIRGQTGIPSNNSIPHNNAESKSKKNRICSPAV